MIRYIFFTGLLTASSCFLIENVLHLEVDCNHYKDKCDHNILEFIFEVCGTDGVTYANSCELAKKKCFDHVDVHIDNVGKCHGGNTNNPTTQPTVTSQTHTGNPLDVLCLQLAREDCPITKEEVCGSDGRTYSNYCEFQKAACMHKTLTVTSFGFCK